MLREGKPSWVSAEAEAEPCAFLLGRSRGESGSRDLNQAFDPGCAAPHPDGDGDSKGAAERWYQQEVPWLAQGLAIYGRSSYSHPEFQNLLHHQLFLWLKVRGSVRGGERAVQTA